MSEPVLSGRGLHVRYGAARALTGASIDVAPGEIVAVTGPSGSGKSTLLHCLAGLRVPDAGTVSFDGARLPADADQRARFRRREIGLVLQFGQLVPELAAVENVALPVLLERRDRTAAERTAREMLGRLGMLDGAGRRPAELSGGEAQRVAIARALAASPRVVLADEPTGALDTVTGEETLRALLDTVRETGAALVLVTHDNRVAAAAQREVTIVDGATEPVEARP